MALGLASRPRPSCRIHNFFRLPSAHVPFKSPPPVHVHPLGFGGLLVLGPAPSTRAEKDAGVPRPVSLLYLIVSRSLTLTFVPLTISSSTDTAAPPKTLPAMRLHRSLFSFFLLLSLLVVVTAGVSKTPNLRKVSQWGRRTRKGGREDEEKGA